MKKNRWKTFILYETILLILSILSIVFTYLNTKLKIGIPPAILGYAFFLSVGLYLGFLLCKNEYKRALKKNND